MEISPLALRITPPLTLEVHALAISHQNFELNPFFFLYEGCVFYNCQDCCVPLMRAAAW